MRVMVPAVQEDGTVEMNNTKQTDDKVCMFSADTNTCRFVTHCSIWCQHPHWDSILQSCSPVPGCKYSPLVLMVIHYRWCCAAWSSQYQDQIHQKKMEMPLDMGWNIDRWTGHSGSEHSWLTDVLSKQLFAHHHSPCGIPSIITDVSPVSIDAHFHTSLIVCVPSNQTDITMVA